MKLRNNFNQTQISSRGLSRQIITTLVVEALAPLVLEVMPTAITCFAMLIKQQLPISIMTLCINWVAVINALTC